MQYIIDPNLAQSFKMPQIQAEDPMNTYAKMMQIQAAQNQNALAQYQLGAAQRSDVAAQNRLKALQEAGSDPTRMYNALLSQGDIEGASKISELQGKTEEAKRKQFEFRQKALGLGLMSALQDPSDAGLDRALSGLEAQGVDTRAIRAEFAQVTDPAQRIAKIKTYASQNPEGIAALNFVAPKPEKFELGGKVVTLDMNPNSLTYKQQITEQAKTMAPGEAQRLALEQQRVGLEGQRVGLEGRRVAVAEEESKRKAAGLEGIAPKDLQKREAAYPQATASIKGFESKSDGFIKDLEALRDDPGLNSITGAVYGRTPSVTGAGRRAQALYDKIMAKGGFQMLQDIKAASATGGALGSVSNQEGRQLQAAFAAIDQKQDAADVRNAINRAIEDIKGSKARMREAYDMTYDYRSNRPSAQPAQPAQPAAGGIKFLGFE